MSNERFRPIPEGQLNRFFRRRILPNLTAVALTLPTLAVGARVGTEVFDTVQNQPEIVYASDNMYENSGITFEKPLGPGGCRIGGCKDTDLIVWLSICAPFVIGGAIFSLSFADKFNSTSEDNTSSPSTASSNQSLHPRVLSISDRIEARRKFVQKESERITQDSVIPIPRRVARYIAALNLRDRVQ